MQPQLLSRPLPHAPQAGNTPARLSPSPPRRPRPPGGTQTLGGLAEPGSLRQRPHLAALPATRPLRSAPPLLPTYACSYNPNMAKTGRSYYDTVDDKKTSPGIWCAALDCTLASWCSPPCCAAWCNTVLASRGDLASGVLRLRQMQSCSTPKLCQSWRLNCLGRAAVCAHCLRCAAIGEARPLHAHLLCERTCFVARPNCSRIDTVLSLPNVPQGLPPAVGEG